jgi:hypothetical protein
VHARFLLEWLGGKSGIGELRFPAMLAAYQDMCAARGLVARPWNPVAAAFTKLTSGRKTYAWFLLADGSRHRLRIYRVSVDSVPNDSARMAGKSGAAQSVTP